MSFVNVSEGEKTEREPPRPRSDTNNLWIQARAVLTQGQARTLWTLNRSDDPRWTPATVRKAL